MRMMRRGQFPQQVQLSPNRVAWRVTDIVEWVSNRPLSQKTRPETLGIALAIIMSTAVPLWNAGAHPAPIQWSSHLPSAHLRPTGIPDFGRQAGKGTIYLFEPRGGKSAALNASPITAQRQILAFAHDDVAAGDIAPRVQHDQTHRDWRRRIRREVATMSPQLSNAERAAAMMADFEQQLASCYPFDRDATWKAAHDAADQIIEEARRKIADRCAELDIPERFAPDLGLRRYSRGENASKERRAELRKIAVTRIAAIEKQARAEIAKQLSICAFPTPQTRQYPSSGARVRADIPATATPGASPKPPLLAIKLIAGERP